MQPLSSRLAYRAFGHRRGSHRTCNRGIAYPDGTATKKDGLQCAAMTTDVAGLEGEVFVHGTSWMEVESDILENASCTIWLRREGGK